MKVCLENIGNIQKAEFEVGDLTIICGQNNTGKTYAMSSLYGLCMSSSGANLVLGADEWYEKRKIDIKSIFNELYGSPIWEPLDLGKDGMLFSIPLQNISYKLLSNIVKALCLDYSSTELFQDMFGKNFNSKLCNRPSINLEFPEVLFDYAKDFTVTNCANNTCPTFFLPSAGLLHDQTQNLAVSFDIHNDFLRAYIIDGNSGTRVLSIGQEVIDWLKLPVRISGKSSNIYNWLDFLYYNAIEYTMRSLLMIIMCHKVFRNVQLLAVERSGIVLFDKDLNITSQHAIVQSLQSGVKLQELQELSQYLQYPKSIKDNINFMRDLGQMIKDYPSCELAQTHSAQYQVIMSLFDEIAQGSYLYDDYKGVQFQPILGNNHEMLSIKHISSSIKSLIHLNFYLRHLAQKGDMLMIDEPELNLHPHNQRKMAVLVTMLVNIGIKVMVTTHSNFFINELNSLMMLHNRYYDNDHGTLEENQQLVKDVLQQQGYKQDILSLLLSSTGVKAYIAKQENGNVVIDPIKIDQYGMQDTGFYDDVDAMYEMQTRLSQGL
jgi:ABC-type transport system involved in cytochrome c biogenesis ATPase subunit